MIRKATATDASSIAGIYNHYVKNTVITFEEEPVSVSDMAARIEKVQCAGLPWLVLEKQGELIGYAYVTAWKERIAYKHSVEVTVYLSHNVVTKGWGTKLYKALFSALEQTSVHAVIGGITLPNAASVGLHEKFGMEKVAHFNEVGYKFERWLDVGYWQLKIQKGC